MKSLKQAIEILDNYLHNSYNVDPLFDDHIGVSRIYHDEKEHYWQLVQCRKEKINSRQIESNIGGAYIVDKQDGKIYVIGSSPAFDWEKEFAKFKFCRRSLIEWKALENEYLNCQLRAHHHYEFSKEIVTCQIEEKEKVIEQYVRSKFENISNTILICYKPFHKDRGQIEFRAELKPSNVEVNTVSKRFRGLLSNESAVLGQLKKYLRVKGLKRTENYWVKINKTQLVKNYLDWEFEFQMEYDSQCANNAI